MKKNNTNRVTFKGIKSKQIEADFTGSRITSDAGALLLREADRCAGFLNRFTKLIVENALRIAKGRRDEAAIILGIHRNTLLKSG